MSVRVSVVPVQVFPGTATRRRGKHPDEFQLLMFEKALPACTRTKAWRSQLLPGTDAEGRRRRPCSRLLLRQPVWFSTVRGSGSSLPRLGVLLLLRHPPTSRTSGEMTTCKESYYHRASENTSAAIQNGSLSGHYTPELIPSSKRTEVFDGIGSPIFAVDDGGAISDWNRKLSTLSGLSLSDVIRKPAYMFVVDGFRPQWERCLSKVLKGQTTECVCEVSLFPIQGNNTRSPVFCRVRIVAQYPTSEMPLELQPAAGAVCFVEVFQEQPPVANHDACAESTSSVTLDDESEGGIGALSLDATNGELAALLDTLRTPFFGIDASGRVDAWNDRMSEATGYVHHEAMGNPFVETFVDAHRREAVGNAFSRALEENGANNFELEFRGKDGELRFLLVNLCTRLDDRRKPVGVVGVAQDVTEVSKHDRAVAAMASELRQLIDTANAPIFGIDCEGYANARKGGT
jgi:PAS domain S-box-containing protein